MKAQYTEYLARLASKRVRPILSRLLTEKEHVNEVADGNFGFLRTNAAYKSCMAYAYKQWKWVDKRLK